MGFKQLFVFTALLLLWKVCKVHGQGARVEYVNQPYCGPSVATTIQTVPQVVVPALYKPCDCIPEPAPIVPSFNGYSGITGYAPCPTPGFFPGFPGPMPPIIVDDGDDDNFHHLLYFLIFAMRNRRCGGGYGGYGGSCNGGCGGGCGGGCNGGCGGYNGGCGGNCGGSCGGSCGCGCTTGFSGCNSCGLPYYPFPFPNCGCGYSNCGCSDTSCNCGCSYSDDGSCCCQGANEINLIIRAADCNCNNNCNCNSCCSCC